MYAPVRAKGCSYEALRLPTRRISALKPARLFWPSELLYTPGLLELVTPLTEHMAPTASGASARTGA